MVHAIAPSVIASQLFGGENEHLTQITEKAVWKAKSKNSRYIQKGAIKIK